MAKDDAVKPLAAVSTNTMSTKKPGDAPKKREKMPKTVTKVLKNHAKLANGRPPTATKPQASLSHKKTRDQIRSHHVLNKQLAAAEAKGDDVEADELKKRIEDLGGLKSYQLASLQGQAKDRGGDSSTVLMEWLKPLAAQMAKREQKIRLLEVGALSTANACSKSGLFDIERIDLYSQAEGILQQDFMERPLPDSDKSQFDIISLSLVLNFVPDPEGRGQMLRRTCQFLNKHARRAFGEELQAVYPALFLVLPAPCIVNARYINEERLTTMMSTLGYVMLERKLTSNLVYYLWQLRDKPRKDFQDFPKKQVNPGAGRNNFCVVLK
ncbi:25S rRNA (adenine2142-N1)-methyltransferase [Elasticomyces elasticus]|nr:25S rRNA (adenine2142-N1)-methyltransferase [Elasticomyces elasticus]KAK3634656.1 25S rRNA (adenine2142-N1)-methyltransferase [Elasticomyces elasticus]KAK4911344.1 25S rRNA (adenine2142-N1)-methyltransferase [Elasticomyces elasticus]KAK5758192.1 25S rRNA (adenine2142-N1)-methyltransferase [Elasticomyces elasticus]